LPKTGFDGDRRRSKTVARSSTTVENPPIGCSHQSTPPPPGAGQSKSAVMPATMPASPHLRHVTVHVSVPNDIGTRYTQSTDCKRPGLARRAGFVEGDFKENKMDMIT
jgi:hypothetical protein